MTVQRSARFVLAAALAVLVSAAALVAASAESPMVLRTSRIAVSGTSNIHDFTATSTAVRLSRVVVAAADGKSALDAALEPNGLSAFEIAVPVATLSSPREGLDKNMHKALKAQQHPEIIFRLTQLAAGDSGAVTATGMLTIAGVERPVTLPLTTARSAESLTVRGEIPVLMTDFGIAPPKAMLGMLKTNPKVTVAFEIVLQVSQS